MDQRRITIQADRDLIELKKMLIQYIQKTYVSQIQTEMYRCKQSCQAKSTKELELLTAFMPYVPHEKQKMCQELIKLLQYGQVVNEMLPMFQGETTRQLSRGQSQLKEATVKLLLYYMVSKMD